VAAGAGRPRGPAALAWDAAGAVAGEFALTAPMLILLGLGAVEFGRATLAYHEVVAASAAGARYAMVHGSGSGSPADAAAVATAAKAGLVTVSTANVTVSASWSPGKAPGDTATVTVSYPFRFVISGLSPITLSSTMTVTISN
jgi:Flp pilus assembly protein TadG